MKKPILRAIAYFGAAVPLCWCLSTPAEAGEAGETASSSHVPLESMSQADYEQYRHRIDLQIKEATSDTQTPNAVAKGDASRPDKESDPNDAKNSGGGYGKGYRARMERAGVAGRAGAFRGGSMGRGGGRNR